ncbi:choice-of-anchor J domain-containing protein [Marinigracilibium pacificum]|uniref:DUF5017 domain-containing protein n=1 Tax=Marinigracilibium pacificum TaxID=2729599 RepID=A0A848J1Y0_9BACT|nr:choice-of-anchor J domain-containing protein [Marinigracilibium pacificum]NMM50587.1 hypothetical protein [Marinigracilibium pacificum]
MSRLSISKILLSLTIILGFTSCDDDQPFDLTTKIGFSTLSFEINEGEKKEIELYVNDQKDITGNVSIEVIPLNNSLEYGVDYVTIPAAVNNIVTINYSKENNSFEFVSLDNSVEENNKTFIFNILSEGTDFELGQVGVISSQIQIKDNDQATGAISKFYDFNDQTEKYGIPAEFSEVIVDGFKTDRGWGLRDFGVDGSWAVNASGFGGDAGEENAWLINNPIQLSGQTSANIKFDVFSNFSGPGRIKVLYSTDYSSGAPGTASWTEITDYDNQAPAVGSKVWTSINLNIEGISASKFVVAFQFIEAKSDGSSSWVIDNLSIELN